MIRIFGALAIGVGLVLSSASLAQSNQKPLKIGVLTDMTSYASGLSGQGSVVAAQLAVADYKAAHSRPVELVSADSQAKADIGSAIARRWFDDEGVDVIVDLPPSSVALAVQTLAKERHRVVLFSAAAALDLVGAQCSPTGFQWAYNTVAVSRALATAVVKRGKKTWFFITADNAYGKSLEEQASQIVVANGGKVLGSAKHPTNTQDFSSLIEMARASGAQVVALANSGSDAVNSLKQAKEFGIAEKQDIVALSLLLSEVKAAGLELAQGLQIADSFYWNKNKQTTEWSDRFAARYDGKRPTSTQAGVYSAITHYLKAADAAGSNEGMAVADKMRALPVNDFMTNNAKILKNGWVERDFYLFQVKKPSESKGEWDILKLVETVPGHDVAPTGAGCSLE